MDGYIQQFMLRPLLVSLVYAENNSSILKQIIVIMFQKIASSSTRA